jgi:hypothetical protein
VRSHTLNAALRRYVEEVAWTLSADTADGAEVPFELVEERGARSTALYCYRPLVDEFLRERQSSLLRLDGHQPALRALAQHEGLARYLKAAGERVPPDQGARSRAVLAEWCSSPRSASTISCAVTRQRWRARCSTTALRPAVARSPAPCRTASVCSSQSRSQ